MSTQKDENVEVVENNKEINEEQQKEIELKQNVENEEKLLEQNASGMYGITVTELEKLMNAYKERGKDCLDLTLMQEYGGEEGIMKKLKTDPTKGIEDEGQRLHDFGSNEVYQEPVPSFWYFVKDALNDMMIRILIVAAIVQIILGATLSDNKKLDWIDGMSIVIAVLVVTLVGSITNYQKAQKFHELNDYQTHGTHYQVIRNGSAMEVNIGELLVGDLVNIGVGEIIPADMFVIASNGIKVNESALTGESNELKKEPLAKCLEEKNSETDAPASPFLLSGTNCCEGNGKAIVIAVGDHSQKGIIRRTVDNAQENSKTPLEDKLEVIAEKIGWFGIISGIITLVALFIRFGIQYPKDQESYENSDRYQTLVKEYMNKVSLVASDDIFKTESERDLTDPKTMIPGKILQIILLCVSIIVVAIPEGLPLAVSLSLAFSIKKLMDQNNLVRKMHSCETMGGANYICTDKTGTLTRNQMHIFKVYNPSKTEEITLKETMEVQNAGSLSADKSENIANKKIREPSSNYFSNEKFWEELKVAMTLNIEGSIQFLDKPNLDGDMEVFKTKNNTDEAFIDFLYRFQSPFSETYKNYIEDKDTCIKRIPFDSKLKKMVTCVQSSKFPTGYRAFSKGGAEKVKEIANQYIDLNDGSVKKLGDQELNSISDKINHFNQAMLRSLYISYRDITKEEFEEFSTQSDLGKTIDSHDMIFVAIVGIRDPLRNGVPEAVLKCHKANVTV